MTRGWRCRFGILALSLMGLAPSASETWAVSSQLSWDYVQSPDPTAAAEGFVLYRGIGTECALLSPLGIPVPLTIPVSQLTVVDTDAPVQSGPLCYEMSAYNQAGESPRSNRAMIQAETLIPAVPGPIRVQAVPE